MKMKKYLMSGIAAIAVCAAFTSCSKENLYDENAVVEKNEMAVREAYAQAFEKAFGKVGANVDWGFGPSRSNTRAGEETPVDLSTHVGAYPNANQWASRGFSVPDPLKDGQKLRVQYYFQMNKITNPNRPDNHQISFFMQQVYDGGTDPMTKYKDGDYSLEKYPAANSTPGNPNYIESGEHMDHLTCGPDHTHTFNFNNGNCSPNPNVGNNGAPLDTDQHTDQIQLMLNTKTSCFGYANSDASFVRDDRWTLVSGAVIDEFCNNNGFAAWLSQWNNENGKNVADAIVDDDWHRSFIGFDFDMLPDDKLYVKDNNGQYQYYSMDLKGRDKVWNGTELVPASSVGEVATVTEYGWTHDVLYPYIPGTTTKIRMVTDQTNKYCGETTTLTDADIEYEVNNVGKYVSLAEIYGLLREYALPTPSGAGKIWVKVGNCADDYYSDWIVSFLPATPGEVPPTPNPSTKIEKLRVIAEDLQVGENTDFDFNDVVFDVIWTRTFSDEAQTNQTSQKVEIKLLAAGGTLPLYVDGKEVHEQFGVDQYTMVNTRAKAKGLKGKDDAQPVTWETSNYSDSGTTIGEIANSIDVYVTKNEQNIHLSAPEGGIASKIAVKFINDQEYVWCDERQDIEDKYRLIDGTPLFKNWVQGLYSYDDWYTYAYDEIIRYRNKLNGAQGN